MAKLNFKVTPAMFDRAPIDVARAFIAAGIAVFPCRESTTEGIDHATGELVDRMEKSPYTSDGLKGATTSRRIVDIWFGERHPGAAIGIPTGEKLGAFVLDLDRHGDVDGHKWLADMEAKHGALPETARATTANGGTHIFFTHVEGVRNRAAIAPGVDTRGEGGYIVGPGSVMADGRKYQWVDHDGIGMPDFADAPDWLLELVVAKKYEAPTQATYTYSQQATGGNPVYVEKAVDDELRKLASTPQGGRNAALNDAAFTLGRLVGGGHLDESDARQDLEAIARQWPNFPKSRATIQRALKDGMAQPRDVPAPSYQDDGTPPVNVDGLLKKKTVAAEVANDNEATASEPAPPAEQKKRGRFELTWFDEIEEGKPKETILKGWLGCGEFTTISGLPGTGKSVVTTDLACHIAAGMDWHGIKVKQGLVVYVAAERKKLTERRMMAFRKHHDKHNVPLLVMGGMLDFTRDEKDAEEVVKIVREAETITGQQCVWVIIDTLTRVFGAGDQNASKDMVRFVRSCDHIMTETKAHVTAIHHSAWSGERGKGAIDLDGAVDASFMVKKEGNKHKLVCDGTNDGEEGDVLAFTMQSVEIGINEDGEPTTAPVLVAAKDGSIADKLKGAVNGQNARALEILREISVKEGVDPESHGYPPGALVVTEERWRDAVYEDAGDKMLPASKRQRFNRAKKDLVADGAVDCNATWVWLVPQNDEDGEA